jgi:diguanylate cyclase (GGDEF)-like protein
VKKQFQKELVDYLYKNFKISIVGMFICSIIVFSILYSHISQKGLLLLWFFSMTAVLAVRYYFLLLYQNDPKRYDTEGWKRLFFSLLLFSTIIWSLAPLFIFEIDDPVPIALLMAVYAGVAAGGVLSLSPYLKAAILFLSLPLLVFLLVLLSKESLHLLQFAFLVAFYYFFMLVIAKKLHQQYLQVLVSNKKYLVEKNIAIESQERLKALFNDSPIGIFFYDDNLNIIDANTNFYRLLGIDTKPDKVPPQLLERLKEKERSEFVIENGNNTLKVLTSPITHNGKTLGWVGTLSDISEERRLLEKTEHQAKFDHLTQIPNRSTLFERINEEVKNIDGKKKKFAVLFIDLDNFKNINDSLGHHVGDKILIEISQRLKKTLRSSDFIARLGGDEFVVVLPNLDPDPKRSMKIIELITQKIHRAISAPIHIEGSSFHLTSSIGVVFVEEGNIDAYEIVKFADIAMYQAKQSGKNKTKYYQQEMDSWIKRRVNIENFQKNAIKENRLFLAYQPIVDIHTQKTYGIEALLRFDDSLLQDVSVQEFIAIAEESGNIMTIGQWIIDQALNDFSKLIKVYDLQKIALNISIKQFQEPHFVQTLVKAARRWKVPFDMIELEITESLFINDIERAKAVMQELRSLGFSISIDDFGTGYSSLSYLKYLPITTLKIDRSFIRDITTNKEDRDLVETIITIAKRFKLTTIAEGIETPQQLQLMQQLECDLYQGYIKSKPLQYDRLLSLLQEER